MRDDLRFHRLYIKYIYLNSLIISRVFFSFILYFVVGISLAILPVYLHMHLGYGPTLVGLVISAQYVATLATRAQAGRMCDVIGAKRTVVVGLAACAASGGFMLAGAALPGAGWSLAALIVSRLILGFAESWSATGATLWGIGRVGFRNTTRVISWNGIATYGALAAGAPFGVMLEAGAGMAWIGGFVTILGLVALGLAALLPPTSVQTGERMPIRKVFWRVLPHGIGLALGGGGFGVIGAFITLYYAHEQWPHAAVALSVFGASFIAVRLLFARLIDRLGGCRVAAVSLAVECLGLIILAGATQPLVALVGASLAGCGFSLVFPALGVEAVRLVSAPDRGAALGVYSVFIDISMGLTGPLAGLVIAGYGYGTAFSLAALAALAAMILALILRRRSLRGQSV